MHHEILVPNRKLNAIAFVSAFEQGARKMTHALLKFTTVAIVAAALLAPVSLRAAAADEAKSKAPPATAPSADQSGPARFYGTISAVDADAKTFTVDNQTYTVVSASELVKVGEENKPATLADAVVGETVRGSYTKSSDGKLQVTKARFGKKSGGGGKAAGKKKESATQPAAKK
jgi:hypothetical protein